MENFIYIMVIVLGIFSVGYYLGKKDGRE